MPLLLPVLAAWMGTTGRAGPAGPCWCWAWGPVAAEGLSVVNVMAVLSLPDMPPAARSLHDLWGVLLLMVVLFGPGRWALDHWIQRWLRSDRSVESGLCCARMLHPRSYQLASRSGVAPIL